MDRMVLRQLGDARNGGQVDFQLLGEQVSRRLRKELTNGARQLQLAERRLDSELPRRDE